MYECISVYNSWENYRQLGYFLNGSMHKLKLVTNHIDWKVTFQTLVEEWVTFHAFSYQMACLFCFSREEKIIWFRKYDLIFHYIQWYLISPQTRKMANTWPVEVHEDLYEIGFLCFTIMLREIRSPLSFTLCLLR